MEHLHERGHEAVAPDLPLHDPEAGFEERARPALEALKGLSGPLVIVGHSQGTAYSSLVAASRPESLLVHLCPRLGGFTPPPGAPERFRKSFRFPADRPDGTSVWDADEAVREMYSDGSASHPASSLPRSSKARPTRSRSRTRCEAAPHRGHCHSGGLTLSAGGTTVALADFDDRAEGPSALRQGPVRARSLCSTSIDVDTRIKFRRGRLEIGPMAEPDAGRSRCAQRSVGCPPRRPPARGGDRPGTGLPLLERSSTRSCRGDCNPDVRSHRVLRPGCRPRPGTPARSGRRRPSRGSTRRRSRRGPGRAPRRVRPSPRWRGRRSSGRTSR